MNNLMEQNLSREADSHTADQNVLRSWYPEDLLPCTNYPTTLSHPEPNESSQ
jgi:hypothetical protein